jgi:hypothetical protein
MTYQPNPDATDGERIASVETILCDMHKRLFGNGQPGEIEEIKRRVADLEKWMWRCLGGGAVLVALWERFKG